MSGSGPSARSLAFDPVEVARAAWIRDGWASAAPGMAVVTSIMRAHQLLLTRANEVLRPFDLTFARFEVLRWLAGHSNDGSLSLKQISELLQVTPATVTNAIDRLETAELIRRVPHATDGRTTLAELTPRGRRVADDATRTLNDKVFTLEALAPRELDQLFALLLKLRASAEDFVPEAAEPAVERARAAKSTAS